MLAEPLLALDGVGDKADAESRGPFHVRIVRLLRCKNILTYVRTAVEMYALAPSVLTPVPCYEDVVMLAVLTIIHSAEIV